MTSVLDATDTTVLGAVQLDHADSTRLRQVQVYPCTVDGQPVRQVRVIGVRACATVWPCENATGTCRIVLADEEGRGGEHGEGHCGPAILLDTRVRAADRGAAALAEGLLRGYVADLGVDVVDADEAVDAALDRAVEPAALICDAASGTTYTPFVGDRGHVGYRCTQSGDTTFVYLAAACSGGRGDGHQEPRVVVYAGGYGDPAHDQPITDLAPELVDGFDRAGNGGQR